MAFENLTEREKQVLSNLIEHYIRSADPVGSRVIAHKFRMGVSSATIRNTLQDLEELGLVRQPHTSAGRIPTDLGYRVYVDYLLKPEDLTESEKERIKDVIVSHGRGLDDILGQTCRVLSDITNQLGVSIAPRFDRGVLRRIELISLSQGRIMAVVVVESGLARSVIVEVETSIDEASLREVEQVLNERLAGLSLGEIRTTISKRLADHTGSGRLVKLIIDSRDRIWADDPAGAIHLAGVERLLSQPEFSEIDRITRIVRLLEDNRTLKEFLSSAYEEGLFITIGRENKFDEILNCSLVTSSYKVGSIAGTIGIIGPTRMEYGKLVSIVDYTARAITEVLSGMSSKEGESKDA
ncbi:MAG TPA: heat-inducible transcriptional repressor HrcA [candidate division Zixibacteria bacterium]|nr:heat-inducible transcription repressor HrcA [candidate division Zixibacteria bacterium]MDD4917211.1 heat-inducible transcriptional repressor HrcA [candidate division Zixibacteria bacterium]MDM7971677.1 heat-inducible transcriptional repressor HrcA [candidate division Zixibacteria bacterium]HOD65873.1 heat-inducible transcriptional repressor HrcA [candidate division Zixibacteria bacterium]HPC11974.1 heat-inducible transcriptional repressor HrcA [candidate division Zixibacteria bacterium]